MTDPFENRPYRSVSQLKEYERCPYAYYLSRVERAWQRPAAWLPQGTAVHGAIEWWERGGRKDALEAVQAVFRELYVKEANEALSITPNTDWWFPSGPHKGEADLVRRFKIGEEQCAKYLAWANNHPEEVVWITPDGTPAIELEFDMDLDGVLVRGYIDMIVDDHSDPVYNYKGLGKNFSSDRGDRQPERVPNLKVRDHKTGNNPGDDFQLGVYAVAVREMYGTFGPYEGDYWMGKSGKATWPFDLRDWTKNAVAAKFHELEDNIAAQRFDPKPEPDKCKFCSVSYDCKYSM
jgi:putative RecB family exonuclease